MSQPLQKQIIAAYRQLFKASLAAVQYSKPARFVVEQYLRDAFRKSRQTDFDPERVARTVEFLDNAARYCGLEHKIVKNLALTWWHLRQTDALGDMDRSGFKKLAFDEHRRTLGMLNATMGMCIK